MFVDQRIGELMMACFPNKLPKLNMIIGQYTYSTDAFTPEPINSNHEIIFTFGDLTQIWVFIFI